MKKVICFTGAIMAFVLFDMNKTSAQESKYKLKLKGEAARAYVREHGYPPHPGKTVHYKASGTSRHTSVHPRTGTTASHRNKAMNNTSTAHRKHKTAATYKHKQEVAARRENSKKNTAHTKERSGSYSRHDAAYYSGHRQTTNWDKVKVKHKRNRVVYKFKKDD